MRNRPECDRSEGQAGQPAPADEREEAWRMFVLSARLPREPEPPPPGACRGCNGRGYVYCMAPGSEPDMDACQDCWGAGTNSGRRR